MTTEVLKNCLHIPKDTNVRHIELDPYSDIVTIVVEDGSWLPDVYEGQEPPMVVVPRKGTMYPARHPLDME